MTLPTMPRTTHPLRLTAGRPQTMAERVEVHDAMRAVFGDAERIPTPKARALFLLDADIIRAANQENRS